MTSEDIDRSMWALELRGVGSLSLVRRPVPAPASGEDLLRITAVGICGSDLHWLDEAGIGDARLTRPLVLGHEFAAVAESGAFKGRRVAVDPAAPCGRCEFCLRGDPNFCSQLHFAGHDRDDGALREWMAWSSECLYPLPESIDAADGAMLEPLGVALHSVDLAHLKTGMSVGVFGAGPIGLLIIQLARLSGASWIVATDLLSHRLDAARACGANEAVLAHGGDEVEQVRKLTGGRGLDVCFEVAGDNDAVDTAIACASSGARVVLVGIPSDDRVSFSASVARRKGLTVKLVRRMKHTYARATDLVARGLVDVRSLVTHRYPLEQFEEAFAVASRRDGIKVILEPGSES